MRGKGFSGVYFTNNEVEGIINANNLSLLNPVLTLADLTLAPRFGVADNLATENRIFSGGNSYGFNINSLTSFAVGVYNGSDNTYRFYGDDSETSIYSPFQNSSIIVQDSNISQTSLSHNYYSPLNLALVKNYIANGLNTNIQINYSTSGVGVVYHVYTDTTVNHYVGGTNRFQIGYLGDVFFSAPIGQEQNLYLNTPTGSSYSRIVHQINSVEQLRTEIGANYWTIYSPIGIGTMGYWQMSTGKLNVVGAVDSAVGFQIGGAATAGNFLRGNGTNFVSSAIQASDLPSTTGAKLPYVEKTATYTATLNDYTINCTSGTFTVNLPTAVGITGRVFLIKNSGVGTITVDGSGTETIDGALTITVSAGAARSIQSTGSNWIIK